MSDHDAVEAWNRRETAQLDRGYMEQIKWERDLAIRQLADLGYGLGEKPRTNGDTISRQDAIDVLERDESYNEDIPLRADGIRDAIITIKGLPSSAQPNDWMEKNKYKILQAGKEGREYEFRIGGRLFAIREKAQ
jgi:hypothetical protein